MPGWITMDYWNGIDEKWRRRCDCGLFPHRLVAYKGVETGRKFMGCHYKSPKCTFVDRIDKPHSQSLSRALTAMWTLAIVVFSTSTPYGGPYSEFRDVGT